MPKVPTSIVSYPHVLAEALGSNFNLAIHTRTTVRRTNVRVLACCFKCLRPCLTLLLQKFVVHAELFGIYSCWNILEDDIVWACLVVRPLHSVTQAHLDVGRHEDE